MIILIHSSKTMRVKVRDGLSLTQPALLDHATSLANYIATLSAYELAHIMAISQTLAEKTREMFTEWTTDSRSQTPAVDSFVGDIYSGLQIDTFTDTDRAYAADHLRILSGLYGILRPNDGICAYRLEMDYKLPKFFPGKLADYWSDRIAACVPDTGMIVNLAAVEYSRTVLPYVEASRVFTPKFLTVDPHSGEPKFVVVHAKIARGAFARWLVTNRVKESDELSGFSEIGYCYDHSSSTGQQPVFVCETFQGKGLSIRLTE